MLDRSRSTHLTITPDGPRGPRRRLAPGCVYLASKLGLPLVLMGFGYDRPWRVHRAWDQFAVPRPCSRARAVVSGEIFVPPELDREGLEHFRRRIEETFESPDGGSRGLGRLGDAKGRAEPAGTPPGPLANGDWQACLRSSLSSVARANGPPGPAHKASCLIRTSFIASHEERMARRACKLTSD